MAIKGQTINVGLDPRAYKELNKLENIIPTHIDLRNGHYTDAKYWESRPGYLEVLTLAPAAFVATVTEEAEEEESNPVTPPSVCFPAAQALLEADVLFSPWTGASKNRASWSWIETSLTGETVYAATTNYPSAPLLDLYKSVDGVMSQVTPFPWTPAFFSNLTPGAADRHMAFNGSGNDFDMFTLDVTVRVRSNWSTYPGGYAVWSNGPGMANDWTRYGADAFLGGALRQNGHKTIVRISAATGTYARSIELDDAYLSLNSNIKLHATANYLYALVGKADGTNADILRLTKDELEIVNTFSLPSHAAGFSQRIGLHAIDDTLIYLLRFNTFGGLQVEVSYLKDLGLITEAHVVIDDQVTISVASASGEAHMSAGKIGNDTYLYYGYNISPSIVKIGPIVC